MDICFLIQRFPGYGGAENYVYQICSRLVKKDIYPVIITSNLDKSNIIIDSRIKIIKLPSLLKIREYNITKGLTKILLKNKYDIIHTNSYGYFHSDLSSILTKIMKKKLVFTSHGFHGLEISELTKLGIKGSDHNTVRKIYDLTLGRNEILSSTILISLSKRDNELYNWMGAKKEKIYEIPLGIDDIFLNKLNEEVYYKLKNEIKGYPILLSIGELSEIKGKDIPIKLLNSIVKIFPDTKLLYIGRDAGLLNYLKQYVYENNLGKNVMFLGYVPREILPYYYKISDILIHSSLAEGFSTVLLESVSMDLPIISTPAGGNGYFVNENKVGFTVPFNDITNIQKYISILLNNPDIKEEFVKNEQKYKKFNMLSWDLIINKYVNLYNNITSF